MNAELTAEKQQEKRVIGRPFPPGVSGNPSGRPKGSFSIKGRVIQYLEEHPEELESLVKEYSSDPRHRALLWKMVDGLPKAQVDVENNGPSTLIELIMEAHESTENT